MDFQRTWRICGDISLSAMRLFHLLLIRVMFQQIQSNTDHFIMH